MDQHHRPVMLAEVLEVLAPRPGGLFLDGTLAREGTPPRPGIQRAGRAPAGPGSRSRALELAGRRLKDFSGRIKLVQATFDNLEQELIAGERAWPTACCWTWGSAPCSWTSGPGFSFRRDEPLDMRMGATGPSAAELVPPWRSRAGFPVQAPGRGAPGPAHRRAVVRERAVEPIATTGRLASVVEQALPMAERRKRRLHPATQFFRPCAWRSTTSWACWSAF